MLNFYEFVKENETLFYKYWLQYHYFIIKYMYPEYIMQFSDKYKNELNIEMKDEIVITHLIQFENQLLSKTNEKLFLKPILSHTLLSLITKITSKGKKLNLICIDKFNIRKYFFFFFFSRYKTKKTLKKIFFY